VGRVEPAEAGQELTDPHLQVVRQRQRGAVGLLDLDAELAEDDVAIEAEVRIDRLADRHLELLQVEAAPGRVVPAGLEVVVLGEPRRRRAEHERQVGVHRLQHRRGAGRRRRRLGLGVLGQRGLDLGELRVGR
jgi:hypothetical protein